MVRQVIHIDEEKCNGCGLCATACHEGAIDIVDGKAKLMRDDYCDGMGDCLPNCPTGAITFETREAAAYDREAVEKAMAARAAQNNNKENTQGLQIVNGAATQASASTTSQATVQRTTENHKENETMHTGCPGSRMRQIVREEQINEGAQQEAAANATAPFAPVKAVSRLQNWPVQIKLAPVNAPYFDGAKLLIAADCTAYAYASFHEEFIKNRVALIGCPKLDDTDYSEKLAAIIRENDIKDVTIVRMEVPCCGGLEFMAKNALQESGKFIPWQVKTISIDGRILD